MQSLSKILEAKQNFINHIKVKLNFLRFLTQGQNSSFLVKDETLCLDLWIHRGFPIQAPNI